MREHLARIALTLGAAGFRAEATTLLSRILAGADSGSPANLARTRPGTNDDLAGAGLGFPADLAGPGAGWPVDLVGADLAAFGGACAVVGRRDEAERWFAAARELADGHRSNWTVRLPLVWALTECGREEEARAVPDEGQGVPKGQHAGVEWLVCLLRRGETDLVRLLLEERSVRYEPDKSHTAGKSWFDDWTAARAFAVYGQPDLLRLWADVRQASVREHLPLAERVAAEGRPTGPDPSQLTDLTAGHAIS
uniref:hypothetical protein n=1 Tax=Nonomuraea sp. CA-252377 TaxID=3240003 RepID=UPI003F493118